MNTKTRARSIALTIFTITLMGCLSSSLTTETQAPTPAPTDTQPPMPTNTQPPMPAETQPPIPTKIRPPVSTDTPLPDPTLAEWTFADLHNPSAPELIEKSGDIYYLRDGWEVTSISYLFKWWGLSEPVLDYQEIKLTDAGYMNKDTAISKADIQALLDALDHLYPTQMMLAGNAWTDDYPSWAIELVGKDGQHILLFSSSTGNPGNGPWNVVYNGRLYAQYDGSLADPLSKLFQSERGQPAASFSGGGREPGRVAFSTVGWPAQIRSGFWGLLPLSVDFWYEANATEQESQGAVIGRSSIGGFGNMVIGRVDQLGSVELALDEGVSIDCDITETPSDDLASAAWEFTCPVDGAAEGASYRYPITIRFGTDEGESLEITGQLWGNWGAKHDWIKIPPPAELARAIPEHEAAHDLLTDHILILTLYNADLDPEEPLKGLRSGEVILLGQTKVNGEFIRYTVATPFALEDGELTYWKLDRTALNEMLQTVTVLQLTHRVLEADPHAVINLWYVEGGLPPEPDAYLVNAHYMRYEITVRRCGAMPGGRFPIHAQPLQAFGYNKFPNFGLPDFVLIHGKPVVASLDLWPLENQRGNILDVLLPDALASEETMPFERVWMEGAPIFGLKPMLTLWIPEEASSRDHAFYDETADAFPVPVDKKYDTLWYAYDLTFIVTDEGLLRIAACDP